MFPIQRRSAKLYGPFGTRVPSHFPNHISCNPSAVTLVWSHRCLLPLGPLIPMTRIMKLGSHIVAFPMSTSSVAVPLQDRGVRSRYGPERRRRRRKCTAHSERAPKFYLQGRLAVLISGRPAPADTGKLRQQDTLCRSMRRPRRLRERLDGGIDLVRVTNHATGYAAYGATLVIVPAMTTNVGDGGGGGSAASVFASVATTSACSGKQATVASLP